MNLGRLLAAQALFVILFGYLLRQRRRWSDQVPDQPDPGPGEMGGNFG